MKISNRLSEGAFLVALASLAALARCFNYRGVFVGPDVIFNGMDSYAHMRRISLTVFDFPKVPTFDYFLNFPEGTTIPWPVGFDFLLAAAAWLFGLGTPLQHDVEVVSAMAIPVLGVLGVLLLYGTMRVFFGRLPAFLGAVVLAFSEPHVEVSQLGKVDHHVTESVFTLLILLTFICGVRATNRRARARYTLLAGAVLTVSLLFWAGAIVYAALPGLFVITCFILGPKRTDAAGGAATAAVAYAVSALLLLLGGLTSPSFRELAFTPLSLSLLHLLALTLGAAICAFLALSGGSKGDRRWYGFTIICVAGVATLVVIALLAGDPVGGVKQGLDYLAASDPLNASTTQAVSILQMGGIQRFFLVLGGVTLLGLPAFFYLLWKHAKSRFSEPELTFLILWFLLTALLMAGQTPRYMSHLAFPLSIALGIALADSGRAAFRAFSIAANPVRRTAAAALLGALVLIPVLLHLVTMRWPFFTSLENGRPEFRLANHAFQWLRGATPVPGGGKIPTERPSYGVLAQWDFGPWINYIAERPTVASSFLLSETEVAAIRTSVDVLLAEKEEDAAARAEASGARYIVATDLHRYLDVFARLQGRPVERLLVVDEADGRPVFRFGEAYFHILNNRMLLFDGSQATAFDVAALGHFRMVYESPYRFQWSSIPQARPVTLPEGEISGFKIFERVAGALIVGSARPLTKVRAEINVRTNQGREFLYVTSVRTDEQGDFSLRLPYFTQPSLEPHHIGALGPYRIWRTGGQTEVRVTEEEVRQGSRLTLPDL